MIDPKAEPIDHRTPYPRIDFAAKRATVEDCAQGDCKCASAAHCRFKRCKNCDMPVDTHGKALFDDFFARGKHGYLFQFDGDGPLGCPDCNGPMPRP